MTFVTKNDLDLGDQASSFGHQHEFADISWYPNQRKAIYRVDDRISSNAFGNGLYNYIPFRSTASVTLAIIRTTGQLLFQFIDFVL